MTIMNAIADLIESGILELYVLRQSSAAESAMVEQMAAAHEEIRQELAAIQKAVESYAIAQAVRPSGLIKFQVMAGIDYYERLKQGETVAAAPVLTEHSSFEDYGVWLNRPDMEAPADFTGVYAKLISVTPQATTAIVWIKDMVEDEVHHQENERFLIVEGSCQLFAGKEVYLLGPGDYFAVPLHTPHRVQVTSSIPCKAILQRIAA